MNIYTGECKIWFKYLRMNIYTGESKIWMICLLILIRKCFTVSRNAQRQLLLASVWQRKNFAYFGNI